MSWPFPLDRFQVEAIEALDEGQSVLVAAPTGSGKTVVAEYAVDLALASGGKAFYTTPIKALSNQKFADLRRRLGVERVGLLTGDNVVNPDAPVVVMTTEVLRNMIYAASPALGRLRCVVLDEVHYLQDAYRGPVWEEVIIHSPAGVQLVCLSATVSNADEVADWIATVRGPCRAVVEEQRPVELVNLYLAGNREAPGLDLLPTLVDGRPNPEAYRLDVDETRFRKAKGRPKRRAFTPDRLDVVDLLAERELLPAIWFIFSRAACTDAMHRCLDAGVRLTTPDESARIREIVEARMENLAEDDLRVLGYGRFLAALEAGVAAHHAGLVPPFKEAVEACFVEGLVKVVFATETLALGINMPARTVVIEKLTKFTGERHEVLTPAEYTQLTGRAGRRGIDPVGHAVVLWSPFVTFDRVAALAASRSFRLTSAFRPTYNMAANLVRRYDAAEAHHLLNLSFAQYQADRSVVALETRLERRRAALDATIEAATCERGSVEEYAALVAEAKRQRAGAVADLRPGDVVEISGRDGRAAVVSTSNRTGGGVKVRLVTTRGRVLNITSDDDEAPVVIGHVDIPEPYLPHSSKFQRAVGARVAGVSARSHRPAPDAAVAAHPVHACRDRDRHLAAHGRAARLAREVEDLQGGVKGRSDSLARRFDRVLRVLEAWGHLDGWSLTDKGRTLARLYHECDLLVAECLHEGVLDGLPATPVAALASAFCYEHRSPEPPPPPSFPSAEARRRFGRIDAMHAELVADEEALGLPLTRMPDPTFADLAAAWAAGGRLDAVLGEDEITAGDFVRVVKQLVDLLRQLGDIAPDPSTADAARVAAEALHRGVVAASSVLVSG